MSTSDAIAIGAALVGAGLTLVGLMVAFLSLWGIFTIRQEAGRVAEIAAREQILTLISGQGELSDKLVTEVQKRVEAEADRLFADLSLSGAFSKGETEEQKPIAEEYPKDKPDA